MSFNEEKKRMQAKIPLPVLGSKSTLRLMRHTETDGISRLREDLEEHLDSIDAAVFSGDYFHQDTKHIERLQFFIDRWNKELPNIAEAVKEIQRLQSLDEAI